MAKQTESEVSVEDILMDIWEKSYRTEAMIRVMIRNQADLLAKAEGKDVDEIMNRINEEVNQEMNDLTSGDSEE